MDVEVKRTGSARKGRPAIINTNRAQHITINRCPPILKLQLIKEADEMDLTLSDYLCMLLQGAGRDVRKAAAMEFAIELEKMEDPTAAFRITEKQINAFEAALLADPDQERREEEMMKLMIEKDRKEAEELLSSLSAYPDEV